MSQREQVMILTGAAGGIGQHLAARLYTAGHKLWLTDLSLDTLRESTRRAGLDDAQRVELSALDVRDPDAWEALVPKVLERFGHVDVLLNIAGFMRSEAITDTRPESVDLHLDVNAKGVIHGTRVVAKAMIRRGSGHIVNLASLMGIAPLPGFALYSASKHAVRGFSIASALELRPFGIYVTAVCPDAVKTSMLDAQLGSDAARIAFSGPRPLTVEEIAETVISQVLTSRPVEVTLAPKRSGRALLSKVVALAPGLAVPLEPLFSGLGSRVQERIRKRRARRPAR
jgi:3-oxoacyl-[acyl-carrier protein] reductase